MNATRDIEAIRDEANQITEGFEIHLGASPIPLAGMIRDLAQNLGELRRRVEFLEDVTGGARTEPANQPNPRILELEADRERQTDRIADLKAALGRADIEAERQAKVIEDQADRIARLEVELAGATAEVETRDRVIKAAYSAIKNDDDWRAMDAVGRFEAMDEIARFAGARR